MSTISKKDRKAAEMKMKKFTIEEVSRHCSTEDFWTIIEDKVYDLSGYTSKHPGGKLILCAAGCDSTVVFNHYHFYPQTRHRSLLAPMQIGVIADGEKKSPQMGEFYQALSVKVGSAMTKLEKHPLQAQFLFFFDYFVLVFCVLFGSYMVYYDQYMDNVPLVIAVSCMAHFFNTRVTGQCHAVLHMQVFGPTFVTIAQYMFHLIAIKSLYAFHLPDERAIFRRKMNEDSQGARGEWFGKRGPYEHQGIHHVRGATIEHDMCLEFACLNGLNHLSPKQPFKAVHHLQRFFVFRMLAISFFLYSMDIAMPLQSSLAVTFLTPLPYQLWDEMICGMIGFPFTLCYVVTSVLLPYYCGTVPFLLAWAIRLALNMPTFFYAQHEWDSDIAEEVGDSDWGRYNAQTCTSLHGDSMWWHPIVWLSGGCCPGTLTYHLEHTLFPGMNYLNLAKIASICESTCKDFNVPYHRIDTYTDLYYTYTNHLINSKEEKSCDTKKQE
jgi:cytochrome b involved in lipid metabolism